MLLSRRSSGQAVGAAGEQPNLQLLKTSPKASWLPSQCWEHLEGGAEPGFPQLCSTSLGENAKASDDAAFSGDGAGEGDGWDWWMGKIH